MSVDEFAPRGGDRSAAVPRSRIVLSVLAVACAIGGPWTAAPARAADAADYPRRAVRFIIPFVPGAGTDLTTRALARKLTETTGQQFLPDNRAGAAGAIGAELTAKASPDGYTICLISSGHTVLSATNDRLAYDLLRDLHAVTQVSTLFYVLTVHPSFPARNLRELLAYAKANPGRVHQGSSGTGALQHFAGEMLAYQAGVKFTHIPYKGGAASLAAVMSGEIEMSFTTLLSARPHMQSGRIRVLGITAGKRSPAIPDIPTIDEAGVPGFEANQWYGVVTSAKVQMPLVERLAVLVREALAAPDVIERLAADGSTPSPSTPAQFKAHLASEIAKWRRLVKDAGLKMD
jgi:tripartite-type tricarboxylate transporter receptor subunit TctC